MNDQHLVTLAPALLEAYAYQFDMPFGKLKQCNSFRRYPAGLPSTGRHKSLTRLTYTEPVVVIQHRRARALPWFPLESYWSEGASLARRFQPLPSAPLIASPSQGMLVIDEYGNRKASDQTAHIGRQHLSSRSKIDRGIVSFTSLWAEEREYYPVGCALHTCPSFCSRQARSRLPLVLQHLFDWFAQGNALFLYEPPWSTKLLVGWHRAKKEGLL